jgi:uncharacterized ubiquitin-like protein YukD
MQRSINLKLIKMRTVILTVAMTIGMMFTTTAQVIVPTPKMIESDGPDREWYSIDDSRCDGVSYIKSNDKWVVDYLKQILKEYDQKLSSPTYVKELSDNSTETTWIFTPARDGKQISLTYRKDHLQSMIGIMYTN